MLQILRAVSTSTYTILRAAHGRRKIKKDFGGEFFLTLEREKIFFCCSAVLLWRERDKETTSTVVLLLRSQYFV